MLALSRMDYELFKYEILRLTGINLNLYKEKQMKRRIENYRTLHKLGEYEEFLRLLAADADQLSLFLDYITINVTDFFRTPQHWQELEEQIIPQLSHPRAWSMACSTGQEAYSLAISLAQHFPLNEIKVLATDIEEHVLEKAEKGFYTNKEMVNVPPPIREKYFEQTDDGYLVRDELHSVVEFRQMNLLTDAFPQDMDLIACRNILIYFTEETKQIVYDKIHSSLVPRGILFTGEAEQIVFYKSHGFNKITKFLYSSSESWVKS